jgi:hypothetical protein
MLKLNPEPQFRFTAPRSQSRKNYLQLRNNDMLRNSGTVPTYWYFVL